MAIKHSIKQIIATEPVGQTLTIGGWVRTFRNNQFIALSDGTTVKTLQVVVDRDNVDPELLKRITTGSAIFATGEVI